MWVSMCGGGGACVGEWVGLCGGGGVSGGVCV